METRIFSLESKAASSVSSEKGDDLAGGSGGGGEFPATMEAAAAAAGKRVSSSPARGIMGFGCFGGDFRSGVLYRALNGRWAHSGPCFFGLGPLEERALGTEVDPYLR